MKKNCEDILDINSHCAYLLFGETTSHLTSKQRGTFQYFQKINFNKTQNEMRKKCFSKNKNSIKSEENMKY